MTKKEQVELCIEAYTSAIQYGKQVSVDKADLDLFLRQRYLVYGVCYFLEAIGGRVSYYSWVRLRSNYENPLEPYWCIAPAFCSTKEEIMETLKYRLEILKTHL